MIHCNDNCLTLLNLQKVTGSSGGIGAATVKVSSVFVTKHFSPFCVSTSILHHVVLKSLSMEETRITFHALQPSATVCHQTVSNFPSFCLIRMTNVH